MESPLVELLHAQYYMEMRAYRFYLAMSYRFGRQGLHGFARMFKAQAMEEIEHAHRVTDFLDVSGADQPTLSIEQPELPAQYSIVDCIEAALEHESALTHHIHRTMEVALQSHAHRLCEHLRWFVAEQQEEELKFQGLLDRLSFARNDPAAILLIDTEVSKDCALNI